ncbi:hypothetical protein J25TS5_25020 [Paenibacillus faecis]|nr:hypothetical protein J25TS5_25020 [Paenibacillus faecis]
MVPKYREVLNSPDATPTISLGELLNKAACIPTEFSPLLIPNAVNAKLTLITGDVSFKVTIHTEPTAIKIADNTNAGRGPDLSIHLPAMGEATRELTPKVSIRMPVWNSLT